MEMLEVFDKVIANSPMWNKEICLNKNHNPPNHLFLHAGQTLIHTCPSCGKSVELNGGPLVLCDA